MSKKRQRAAALHDASRGRERVQNADRSWSAAALCRFGPPVEANFHALTPATAGTYVIDDLPSMTRQWIRVRGVSKKSVGPWSQMANKVVP